MKILINTPNIHGLGGVSNHYFGLSPYWSQNVLYNSLGSKRWRAILTPITVLKFIYRLIFFRPDIILLNPSLGNKALIRDFFYLKLAKLFYRKVAIFIHGFNWEYANNADWKWIIDNLNLADCVIVLAQSFKNELIRRGVTTRLFLSTTKVKDTLVEEFDIVKRTGRIKNLLFLSRIERTKGVYELVDTYKILKSKYGDLTLTFVGDGSELLALKQYVEENELSDVRFAGGLIGDALKIEYEKADFFLFFSYGEGMPTVVLEAMAFGLPVVTRAGGGLCDFFEDGKMGRITNSMNPMDYAKMIIPFLENAELTKSVSLYNYQYAKEHFMASQVALSIENQLKQLVNT